MLRGSITLPYIGDSTRPKGEFFMPLGNPPGFLRQPNQPTSTSARPDFRPDRPQFPQGPPPGRGPFPVRPPLQVPGVSRGPVNPTPGPTPVPVQRGPVAPAQIGPQVVPAQRVLEQRIQRLQDRFQAGQQIPPGFVRAIQARPDLPALLAQFPGLAAILQAPPPPPGVAPTTPGSQGFVRGPGFLGRPVLR